MKNTFAIFGIIVGLSGTGIAVYYEFVAPKPTTAEKVTNSIIEKTRELIGKPTQEKKFNWFRIAQFPIGVLAILLGVIAWARKENFRLSLLATGLGTTAAAWEFVLTLVVILMVIVGAAGFAS